MMYFRLVGLLFFLLMGVGIGHASPKKAPAAQALLTSNGVILVTWNAKGVPNARTELRIFKQNGSGVFKLFSKVVVPPRLRTASLALNPGTYRFSWRMPTERRYARASKPSLALEILTALLETPSPPEPSSPSPTPTYMATATPTATATSSPTAFISISPTPIDSLPATVLVPGNGFGGITVTPPNVGNIEDAGYNAEVIARWATVPYQVIKSNLRVGVVAYHRNGVEKVSFSANGGPWIDSSERSVNPSTGINEYWVTLQASDFPDGKVEVRAIAYPKLAGKPRLLAGEYQSSPGATPSLDGMYALVEWTNAYGTYDRPEMYVSSTGSDTLGNGSASNPFFTLSRAAETLQENFGSVDGATILCYPGEYSFSMKWGYTFAKAPDRMLTIRPAPGVAREQVVISAARPKVAKVHLLDVTLKTDETGNFYLGYTDLAPDMWLEGVKVTALNGRYTQNNSSVLMKANSYVTETEWTDTPDGPVGSILVRNTVVSKIKSDLVSGSQVILNVIGSDIDPADSGAHPDVWQIYRPNGTLNNHVIDGLKAQDGILAQGIFIAALPAGEKIRNVALVNIIIRRMPSFFTSQINKDCEHLVMANVTLDQTLFIRAKNFTDTSLQGNIFNAVTLDLNKTTPEDVAAIDWQHNHFVDISSYGTYSFGSDVTSGAAPVVNWEAGDFRPLSNSILAKRVPSIYSNYDQSLQVRNQPLTAVGALEEIP